MTDPNAPTQRMSERTVAVVSGRGIPDDETGNVDRLAAELAPSIRVTGRLGSGGMGSVYLGFDDALRRPVAIKLLAPELSAQDDARARFLREAQAMAALSHPHIVAVFRVGVIRETQDPYFVMQFVDGTSLADLSRKVGAMDESSVRRIVGEVAAALGSAHAHGVVHRDIKPANVMIERASGCAIVVDFGISTTTNPSMFGDAEPLTAQGMYLGTPRYASPEQVTGVGVGPASDVYSLGALAFELLTGRPPFEAASAVELLAAHLKDPAPKVTSLRPDVSEQLAELVDQCLEKAAERRPTAESIERFLLPRRSASVEWPPPGLAELAGTLTRVATAGALALGLGLLCVLVLTATPTRSSVQWHAPEQSEFWQFIERQIGSLLTGSGASAASTASDATPLWLFALATLALLHALALAATIWRAWRFARALWRCRALGYPLPVLLDVAGDARTDTESLINGTGDFALLAAAERHALLQRRRVQRRWIAATALSVAGLAFLWLRGVAVTSVADEPLLVQSRESVTLLLVFLIGALGTLAASLAESRARTQGRGWRSALAPRRQPRVRPEVVHAWLRGSGSTAQPRQRVALLLPPFIAFGLIAYSSSLLLAVWIAASAAQRNAVARGAEAQVTDAGLVSATDGRSLGRPSALQWRALLADPASPPGLEYYRATPLPDTDRMIAARAVLPAFCLNPREIAFGVDRQRSETLREMVRSAPPDSSEVVAVLLLALANWTSDAPLAQEANRLPFPVGFLSLLSPRGTRARLAYCHNAP